MNFDLIIIGSGPGGYVSAIRASQLGMKTAIIEKESLGGVCLNWGCIPTKSLLKSAEVFNYIINAKNYGLDLNNNDISPNISNIIKRSRDISNKMSKGVSFLMKKNNIEVIYGIAKLNKNKIISVISSNGDIREYKSKNIIISTGSKPRELFELPQDGKKIINYKQALNLSYIPKNMVIVGSGAIGLEFAYFYNTIGSKITLIESLDNIAPLEDYEISKQLENSFKKRNIDIYTSSSVYKTEISKEKVKLFIKNNKKNFFIETDIVLSSVGVIPNTDDLGLEEINILTDKKYIVVDNFYKTSSDGYYAIGDIIKGPSLAHVASAEGIVCVEKIKGLNPKPINYNNIPSCIYCNPEIASVGLTENQSINNGYNIKIGKFPFKALGKSTINGDTEGFIKIIFDSKYGEILGCHMIGSGVTEIISEIVISRNLETTNYEIIKSIHPHPTISESIIEAASNAYNECINL